MQQPYYQDDSVTLYHGDCREVLASISAGSVDLLVTDPPYGQRYLSGWGGHRPIAGDDGTLDVPAALGVALRTLRRGRHVYIFGRFDLSTLPLASPVELVWDKQIVGMGDLAQPWGASHEPITFALHQTSKANREKGFGALSARMRRGSVISVQRAHSGGALTHPTEKPVLLLRQLIESSSVIGETVMDPFAGAGSTLVAAKVEGRRAIGVEIDERYCEAAAKRLSTGIFDFKETA